MPGMTVEALEQEASNAANDIWGNSQTVSPGNLGHRDGSNIGTLSKVAGIGDSPPNLSTPQQQPSARETFLNRFKNAGVKIDDELQQRPTETEWRNKYAELVRKEAIQKFADHMVKNNLTANDLNDTTKRWLTGVRVHDSLGVTHLFPDKPRGHGQEDGSTDGRLLRKLMMAASREAVRDNPYHVTPAELNYQAARMLNNLLNLPGGNSALKKAMFLTKEKLLRPQTYKQKYARLVPFGEDDHGNTKWVKASRRFYTPASFELPLPDYPNNSDNPSANLKRTTTPVRMGPPRADLPDFGPDKETVDGNERQRELINDVGQKSLGECWLQAAAASLPRHMLKKLFSWKHAYGSEGVTTRLHDENGEPIYIRTPKNQLWNNASDHNALWPAALAASVAKVLSPEFKQFRIGRNVHPYDHISGLPVYSVRNLEGRESIEAASLLTGNDAKLIRLFNETSERKEKEISYHFNKAKEEGNVLVANFGNFKDPNGHDDGQGHSTVLLDLSSDGTLATIGNTWKAGLEPTSLSKGHKIFDVPTSRIRSLVKINSNGGILETDKYVQEPSHPNGNPRSFLGNFMPKERNRV
jgi:hypothetical protein